MSRPSVLLWWTAFFLPFSATAVINVTSITFGLIPSVFFVILLIGHCLALGNPSRCGTEAIRIHGDHLLILVAIAGFFVSNCISLFLASIAGHLEFIQVTQTAFLTLALVALCTFSLLLIDPDVRASALDGVRVGGQFAAIWGFAQAAMFYVHIPYPSFLFNNSISDFANGFSQEASGLIRISSVSVEPSMLAFSLLHPIAFFSSLYLMSPAERDPKTTRFLILAWLVLLVSTSTTGYIGLAVVLTALLAVRPLHVATLGVVGAAVGGVLLAAFPVFAKVLSSFTFGKSSSWSYQDRTSTMVKAIESFHQRPFFGWGWGHDLSFSAATLIPANVGAVGTGLFLAALVGSIVAALLRLPALPKADPLHRQIIAGVITLLVSITCSLTSGLKYVILDTWFWWGLLIALISAESVRPVWREGYRVG